MDILHRIGGPSARPRAIRRALAHAALALLATQPLGAQGAGPAAVGRRVMVDVCGGPGAGPAGGERTATLLALDSTGVQLEHEAPIPMSRVRGASVNVTRSRELEPLGVIIGAVAGVWLLQHSQGGHDTGGGLAVGLPVSLVGGGAVGYLLGQRLSGAERWTPLALPASHGSLCP